MEDDENDYKKLRDVPCIKAVIGKKLLDITENEPGEPAVMYLMFEEGTVVEVAVTEGHGLIVSPGGN